MQLKPEETKNPKLTPANSSLFEPARLKRVMITAGGTGGHIFPGIAVAQALIHKGVSVRWVGTDYGLEKDIVPKANIPLHYLPIRALRGKGLKRYLIFPWMLAKSVWQAWRLVKKTQPQLVFSLGGYASGPLAIAARLAGVPLVVHEQNAAPGLTNRFLAPRAALILSGLPNQFAEYPHYHEVGNPVRESFVQLHERRKDHEKGHSDEVKLLVVGGSQGALKLNQALPLAIRKTLEKYPQIKLRVVHQAGKAHVDETRQAYAEFDGRADVVTFIDDMAGAYEWADVIVGRAGALTVSEVAAAGVACIFIPLAIAMDDHQTKNAKTLADQDAALIVSEAELQTDLFDKALRRLLLDTGLRQAMADKAYSRAKVNAAQAVVELLDGLLPENRSKENA